MTRMAALIIALLTLTGCATTPTWQEAFDRCMARKAKIMQQYAQASLKLNPMFMKDLCYLSADRDSRGPFSMGYGFPPVVILIDPFIPPQPVYAPPR